MKKWTERPAVQRPLSRREFLGYLATTGLLARCQFGATQEPKKKRVLVVGAGVAGLAAGVTLLEKTDGELQVDLISQGHQAGGKATSWTTRKDGLLMEDDGFEGEFLVGHGFHALFGFYTEMLSMLRRAGADLERNLVDTNRVIFFHEHRDNLIHRGSPEHFAHEGITPEEIAAIAFWGLLNIELFEPDADITHLDEHDFREWAVGSGLPPGLVDSNTFRYAEHVFFNHPEPVSAYAVIKFLRLAMGMEMKPDGDLSAGDIYFARGDFVENVVQPLVDYFQSLGGRIAPRLRAARLVYSDNRITGIEVAQPDPPDSHHEDGYWPDGIVTTTDARALLDDYDGYILAIPHDCFLELNPEDRDFWSEKQFANVRELRSGSSLSCRFWCREPVGTEQYPSIINGMPEPTVTVVDYAPIFERYADGRWASVIDTTGALNAFEDYSEEELLEYVAAQIGSVTGLRNPLDADPEFAWIRRNTGRHGRLFIPVPNGLRYRPWPKTPFDNMFLAGDWVRNQVDLPTMEGAMRSAIAACDELLAKL